MKNSYQENLKRSAKLFHRNERDANFTNGLLVYHLYPRQKTSMLSWWDDVDFILNNYQVKLSWQHPRQDYLDYINSETLKSIDHIPFDIFASIATPNYIKVGKSRKKVSSYVQDTSNGLDEFSVAYDDAFERLSLSSEFVVRPDMRGQWSKYGYVIDICAPIEIHGVDDLTKLVTLVKRILNHETDLDHEFPDYSYTRDQWIAEGLHNRGDKLEIAHQIK